MATWPNVTEALQAIGEVNTVDEAEVESCLAAAIDVLGARCDLSLDEDEVVVVPDAVRRACVMYTARLLKRRFSPEGVAAIGFDGTGLRVSRVDPDIEALIAPYVSWGIAG